MRQALQSRSGTLDRKYPEAGRTLGLAVGVPDALDATSTGNWAACTVTTFTSR